MSKELSMLSFSKRSPRMRKEITSANEKKLSSNQRNIVLCVIFQKKMIII